MDPSWTLVSSLSGEYVYAYGQDNNMFALAPGDETTALTMGMTMLDIPVAEFAQYDDVNIQVIGYAIGTEGVGETIAAAWAVCKEMGGL